MSQAQAGLIAQGSCPLCAGAGGRVVHSGGPFRLVHVEHADLPAFYRIIWHTHVAEFSDLARADRHLCLDALVVVERALRDTLLPRKINLASLGNQVPHLHWHVVARFDWDPQFPDAIWAPPLRSADRAAVLAVQGLLSQAERLMAAGLQRLSAQNHPGP